MSCSAWHCSVCISSIQARNVSLALSFMMFHDVGRSAVHGPLGARSLHSLSPCKQVILSRCSYTQQCCCQNMTWHKVVYVSPAWLYTSAIYISRRAAQQDCKLNETKCGAKAYIDGELPLLGGGCAIRLHHVALMCHLLGAAMIHLLQTQQQRVLQHEQPRCVHANSC